VVRLRLLIGTYPVHEVFIEVPADQPALIAAGRAARLERAGSAGRGGRLIAAQVLRAVQTTVGEGRSGGAGVGICDRVRAEGIFAAGTVLVGALCYQDVGAGPLLLQGSYDFEGALG
jgi:hypothetical protein